MTHSEEEKGGRTRGHTHSTTRAATASENPNTGEGREVEETQARETTHHRAPKGKEIAVALIAPGQFTLDQSVSQPASQPANKRQRGPTAMHSFI